MGLGGGAVVSRVLGSIPAPSNVKFSYIEPGESQRPRRLACSDGRGMGLNLGTALVQLRIEQLCFDLPLIQKVVDKKNPEIIFNFFFVFFSFFFHFILVRCLSSERCQTLGGLCQNRFLSLAPIFYQYHDLPY